MRLHLPSLLLIVPVLTGAAVATVAPRVPTEPTVELGERGAVQERPARECRLLPRDQQPPRAPRGRSRGGDVQRIVLYVPATTCNVARR